MGGGSELMASVQNLLAPGDRGATFSPDLRYRYALWREWGSGPWLCWVLLNPSTADAVQNDPTVERCERRARAGNYGGVVILNIFAYRTTDPKRMMAAEDPVGPDNDNTILYHARMYSITKVICAWGVHGAHLDRGRKAEKMLREAGLKLHCLGLTSEGHPRHPLYVAYEVEPVPWCGQMIAKHIEVRT